MKLYLLRPIGYDENFESGPWNPWYDKTFGYVISAKSSKEARKLAGENSGDENLKKAWLDPSVSACTELKPLKNSQIIIEDYRRA